MRHPKTLKYVPVEPGSKLNCEICNEVCDSVVALMFHQKQVHSCIFSKSKQKNTMLRSINSIYKEQNIVVGQNPKKYSYGLKLPVIEKQKTKDPASIIVITPSLCQSVPVENNIQLPAPSIFSPTLNDSEKSMTQIECPTCLKFFSSMYALLIHKKQCHVSSMHCCPVCSQMFDSMELLETHCLIEHCLASSLSMNFTASCTPCKIMFTSQQRLDIHNEQVHKQSSLELLQQQSQIFNAPSSGADTDRKLTSAEVSKTTIFADSFGSSYMESSAQPKHHDQSTNSLLLNQCDAMLNSASSSSVSMAADQSSAMNLTELQSYKILSNSFSLHDLKGDNIGDNFSHANGSLGNSEVSNSCGNVMHDAILSSNDYEIGPVLNKCVQNEKECSHSSTLHSVANGIQSEVENTQEEPLSLSFIGISNLSELPASSQKGQKGDLKRKQASSRVTARMRGIVKNARLNVAQRYIKIAPKQEGKYKRIFVPKARKTPARFSSPTAKAIGNTATASKKAVDKSSVNIDGSTTHWLHIPMSNVERVVKGVATSLSFAIGNDPIPPCGGTVRGDNWQFVLGRSRDQNKGRGDAKAVPQKRERGRRKFFSVSEMSMKCSTCQEQFWYRNDMKSHSKTFSQHRLWTCVRCGATVTDRMINRHSARRPEHLKCAFCMLSARNDCEMFEHCCDKHLGKDVCVECSLKVPFFEKELLVLHLKQHHNALTSLTMPCLRHLRDDLFCLTCQGSVMTTLGDASDEAFLKCRLQCLACDNGLLEDEGNLARHRRATQKHPCIFCNLIGDSECKVLQHLRDEHPAELRACPVCEKFNGAFVSDMELFRHWRKEHKPRFCCAFCPKSFALAKDFDDHTHVHTGEKPHQCEICGLMFGHKISLRKHLRCIHGQGSRMYQCPYCETVIRSRGEWRLHIHTVHRDENESICTLCGQLMTELDSLDLHLQTCHQTDRETFRNIILKVENEKTYECLACNYRFGTYHSLQLHNRLHEQKTNVFCEICGAGYTNNRSYKKHARREHPEIAEQLIERLSCKNNKVDGDELFEVLDVGNVLTDDVFDSHYMLEQSEQQVAIEEIVVEMVDVN